MFHKCGLTLLKRASNHCAKNPDTPPSVPPVLPDVPTIQFDFCLVEQRSSSTGLFWIERIFFYGWSLFDDIMQNTQCKVALENFTATLSSNYVEDIELLRF